MEEKEDHSSPLPPLPLQAGEKRSVETCQGNLTIKARGWVESLRSGAERCFLQGKANVFKIQKGRCGGFDSDAGGKCGAGNGCMGRDSLYSGGHQNYLQKEENIGNK